MNFHQIPSKPYPDIQHPKQLSQSSQNQQLDEVVQQFLDHNALCTANISSTQTQAEKDKNETTHLHKDTTSLLTPQKQPIQSKRSIFHNFQKHLITLLKKFIKIKESTFAEQTQAKLCRFLWQSFLKNHSNNKLALHMIFGLATSKDIHAQFANISLKYLNFCQICKYYGSKQITVAQKILREQVAKQIEQISKQKLRTNCSMQKFEVFYEYLQSFRLQIAEGPITNRMLKSRKSQVIAKLCESTQKSDAL